MMRVKAVAPLRLPAEEMVRRQRRYTRLGGDRLSLSLVNLPEAAPRRLDSAGDIALSERLVRTEIGRTDPDRFDLVLPDCVLDPGVAGVAATAEGTGEPDPPVPVAGILRLAAGHLAALGQPFAAVARNRPIADELAARLTAYGLADRLVSIHVLDADFCLVSDDAGWSAALAPLAATLAASGVRTLLNGCSAVELPDNRINGVLVVDPTWLALRLLAVADETGLYRRPPRHATPVAAPPAGA